MAKAKRSYTGVLAQPIKRRRLSLLDDEAAENRRIAREMAEKLSELAKSHGIDWDGSPDASTALMLALARTHVPGFRVIAPAGRKKGLSELDKAYLRREVDAVKLATGKTMSPAIAQVMKTEPWRDKLAGKSVGALAQQLKDGAKWLRIVADAEAYAPQPEEQ